MYYCVQEKNASAGFLVFLWLYYKMKSNYDKKSKGSWLSSSKILILLAIVSTVIPVIYLAWYTHVFDEVYRTIPKTTQNLRKDASVIEISGGNKLNSIDTVTNNIQRPNEEGKFDQTHQLENSPLKREVQQQHLEHTQQQLKHEVNLEKPTSPERFNLPGAKNHPILTLSDEELRNTGVDVLMSWYGESDGGGSCAGDFGNSLVNRWRDTRKTYCAENDNSPQKTKSKIDCFLVEQTRHHGHGDNLCVFENVAINLGLFGKTSVTSPVIQRYVDTQHNVQPYIRYDSGFIEGNCEVNHRLWKEESFPGWNSDFAHGVHTDALVNLDNHDLCQTWIEHPVLLTERDTFANFFHDSEDFVNVFLALAILRWTPAQTQIFLTDLYPEGPFWEMWSKVFSHGEPALTAFQLKAKYGKPDGENNYVCFKSVAFGIYGPAAPTTIASWDTPCFRTALVRAYSDFVIRSLGLQHRTHYAQPTPPKTIRITYMSRRASKEWPERKYCNDQTSFFLCKLWEGFGPRRLGRMISNDAEVVRALKSLSTNPEVGNNGEFQVIVQDVDYNVLTFEEQIGIDVQTDIMVGPHGAGLMHNIFMPDRAALIELFVDGSSANRHFHNLAHWYGRIYEGQGMSNPVDIPQLLNIVKNTIHRVGVQSY